jgi:hypothetical protein
VVVSVVSGFCTAPSRVYALQTELGSFLWDRSAMQNH